MSKPEEKPTSKLSETDWFPHDVDAMNDAKVAAMLHDFKGLGYGLFWHINELLHAEKDGKLPLKKWLFGGVAGRMGTDVETVEKFINNCIDDYELYTREGDYFTSNRVQKNKQRKEFIRQFRIENGAKGGKQKATNRQANAKQLPSKVVASAKQNVAEERRGYTDRYISSLQNLQDSLKGTPLPERLLGAFVQGFPRHELSADEKKIVEVKFLKLSLDEQIEAVQFLTMDLESKIEGPPDEYLTLNEK